MIDSIGSRTMRCAAASALALLIPLAVTATSSARPYDGGVRSSRPPAQTLSRLPFLLTHRGLHRDVQFGDAAIRRGAKTTAAGAPCGDTPGLLCSTVVVPLDRTGVVPGTVSLHIEVLPAQGTPRGAIFLIAGGPGQGSGECS